MKTIITCILSLVIGLFFNKASAQQLLQSNDTLVCKNDAVSKVAILQNVDSAKFNTMHFSVGFTSYSYPIALGFSFNYFGYNFSQFCINSNYFISLYDPILSPINPGGSSASHIWNNFIIGINLNLKTAICLGHQNLNFEILPNDATKIRYQFFGAPGSRKLVVDYCEMRQLGTTNPSAPIICSTNLVTNQVISFMRAVIL